MTFECTICNATFSHKHHLVRHMNKKRPCVSKATEGTIKNISSGSVFNITIDNKMYEISNIDKEQFIRQLMLMCGINNIKEVSSNEVKQDVILPETKNNVIVQDIKTALEKQIDLDNKRNEYIDKVKKYFHRRAINLLKKTSNKLNPTMSIKAIAENKKLLNYELKKAYNTVSIPDEYVYTGDEKKTVIQQIKDKDTLELLINKSMNLHDEIVDMEYRQFNLADDIEGEYEEDTELKNKRNMLCNIKRILKMSGVDLTGIQYTSSKIIKT